MTTGKSKAGARLFMVFFMFSVTLVCISIVAAVHLGSRERVLRNEALYLRKGIMAAAGLDVPPDAEAVLTWYDRCVTALPGEEAPVWYEIRDAAQGARRAVVFNRRGAGLWGTIEAVVGLDPALSEFVGIAFVKQNETPGLGARIMEPWYGEQIKGRRGGLTLVAEGTRSSDPTRLDAITGATITSTAVRDLLNRLIEEAPAIVQSTRTVPDGATLK